MFGYLDAFKIFFRFEQFLKNISKIAVWFAIALVTFCLKIEKQDREPTFSKLSEFVSEETEVAKSSCASALSNQKSKCSFNVHSHSTAIT